MFAKPASIVALAAVSLVTSFAPPSGRPPVGPLQRVDPKMYDLNFGVQIGTAITPYARPEGTSIAKENYDLADAPIVIDRKSVV